MKHTVSLNKVIRESDSSELESLAAELVNKRNEQGLSGEEQEALWSIPKHYKSLTGQELILDTKIQLVS